LNPALLQADPRFTGAHGWGHRIRVAEAAILLIVARALVAWVPFRWWRSSLGAMQDPKFGDAVALIPSQAAAARAVARALERADSRLPLHFKCLPRAMATQWMLRRRSIPAAVVLGVLVAESRGTINDLHAWVTTGNCVLIGELQDAHVPVLRLATE
jgi:hypothetical protein